MQLHAPTFFLMSVVLTLVIGLYFLLAWNQRRTEQALAHWGAAHLLGGVSASLLGLRGIIPDMWSNDIANAMMLGAYGLLWSGIRSFERKPPCLQAVFAVCAIWLVACQIPVFDESFAARNVYVAGVGGIARALGALELWRGRSERLASRPVAIGLALFFTLFFCVRIPAVLFGPKDPGMQALDAFWLAIFCFVGMVLTVAVAFTLLSLTKERAESDQRRAAEIDGLTGVLNRGAFVARAAPACGRAQPRSLLLFDLDHFKAINDTYGHEVGDAALLAFAHLGQHLLPRDALFGRLGGEEFACLIAGCDLDEAVRLAERVRTNLSAIDLPHYRALSMRVSVGVAYRPIGEIVELDVMMREADAALYEAKRSGRDRVVCFSADVAERAA